MNAIVKIYIENRNPPELFEDVRTKFKKIKSEGKVGAYLPINRSSEGRIDCYLFDFEHSREQLGKNIRNKYLNAQLEVTDSDGIDIKLIRLAALAVEELIDCCPTEDERQCHTIKHLFHYVMNGLGYDYYREARLVLKYFHELFRKLSIEKKQCMIQHIQMILEMDKVRK